MNYRYLFAPALLAALWFAPALAATTSTPTSLVSTAYTDLGAGPIYLAADGAGVVYLIGDSQPAASQDGIALQQGAGSIPLQTTSHVWAKLVGPGPASAIVSSGSGITGFGGSGGGGSVPTGPAGSPNAAVVSVQGVSGGTAEPVSLASLPALATGANTIGAVTQASGPWTVSWSGQTVAATESGSWTIGGLGTAGTPSGGVLSVQGVSGGTAEPVSLASLPALAAGSATVGNVGINNNPVATASFATSQAAITTTSSAAALAARTGAVGTGRVSVTIYNSGAVTAWLGASTSVTASTGLPILPGGSYTKRTTAALYAVTASGSTTLEFDEEF